MNKEIEKLSFELSKITDQIKELHNKAEPLRAQINYLKEQIMIESLTDISPEIVMNLNYATLSGEPYKMIQNYMRHFPNLLLSGYNQETLQGCLKVILNSNNNIDTICNELQSFIPYIKPYKHSMNQMKDKIGELIKVIGFLTEDCGENGIIYLIESNGMYYISITSYGQHSILHQGELKDCILFVSKL